MINSVPQASDRRLPRASGFFRGLCLMGMMPFAIAAAFEMACASPAAAAERVTLTYGFAEISTSVQALRDYAERGEVDEELDPYLRFLNEEQRSQFRSALQAKQDIGPVEMSQFLYSSIGNNILRSLGDVVRTPSRRNGAQGLRSALVLAAAEPEGLSVLGVLENLPTNNVRIDSQRVFQALNGFTGLITDTRIALAAIEQQAIPVDLSAAAVPLPDLVQSGPYAVNKQVLTMVDTTRDRQLTVDLYLPESSPERPALSPALSQVPLVVASHGLAGDRTGFATIAQHLASHGFAVAALDHPGSDRAQFQALLEGRTDEIANPTEFSDRPRDISFLLDEFTRLNRDSNSFISNRLDMEKIGIIGHSFGGYTALALAGAQLNFDNLKANCDSTEFIFNAANTSMLLQCTALAAPEQFSANLQDDRIKAVMAMNPVTSSLFGPTGFSRIAIPSLLISGSADPVAPALLEQIRPFTWLNSSLEQSSEGFSGQTLGQTSVQSSVQTSEQLSDQPSNQSSVSPDSAEAMSRPQHYLALIEGGSHLYEAPELDRTDVSFANSFVSPNIPLSDNYLKALSLGFMQMTIAGNADYQEALTGSAIVKLGQPSLPLYVINTLTEEMLKPLPGTVVEPPDILSPEPTPPDALPPDALPSEALPPATAPTRGPIPANGS
jgi:predicted dienelactone hydrolase